MYFYKKVEINIFFKYSDFGQGESTLTDGFSIRSEGDSPLSLTA